MMTSQHIGASNNEIFPILIKVVGRGVFLVFLGGWDFFSPQNIDHYLKYFWFSQYLHNEVVWKLFCIQLYLL